MVTKYADQVVGMSAEEKRRTLKRIYERKRCLPYILAGLILGKDVFM